jgi:hypothetical protein
MTSDESAIPKSGQSVKWKCSTGPKVSFVSESEIYFDISFEIVLFVLYLMFI